MTTIGGRPEAPHATHGATSHLSTIGGHPEGPHAAHGTATHLPTIEAPHDAATHHTSQSGPPAPMRDAHHDHTGAAHTSEHAGHGGHGDHVGQFRRLFWVNLVVAVPVVAFSTQFAMLVGYDVPGFPGARWIAPVLGTVMYVWGGAPFLTGAVAEARARRPGMMLLVALAITVAFVASWGATVSLLDHTLEFWWELALLVVVMLLGHWVEMRSLAQTTSALDSPPRCCPTRPRGSPATRPSRSRPRTCGSATSCWSVRAAASRPTVASSTATPTWTSRWSPASPARSRAARARPSPLAPSRRTPG